MPSDSNHSKFAQHILEVVREVVDVRGLFYIKIEARKRRAHSSLYWRDPQTGWVEVTKKTLADTLSRGLHQGEATVYAYRREATVDVYISIALVNRLVQRKKLKEARRVLIELEGDKRALPALIRGELIRSGLMVFDKDRDRAAFTEYLALAAEWYYANDIWEPVFVSLDTDVDPYRLGRVSSIDIRVTVDLWGRVKSHSLDRIVPMGDPLNTPQRKRVDARVGELLRRSVLMPKFNGTEIVEYEATRTLNCVVTFGRGVPIGSGGDFFGAARGNRF